MKIDRLLLIGIVSLAVSIVAITTTLLSLDMLKISKGNLDALNAVASSVEDQNTILFEGLSGQATEVGENIWNITDNAASEQLKNVGQGIAEEIKAVMSTPFASTQALAKTLLFEKTEAERNGEAPSRERVGRYLLDFLINSDDVQATFSCWEKDAFDGKDAEFVGQENADEDMDIGLPDYVSEGAFLPWYYKSEDEDGNERIIRGFTDDYLVSDFKYYTAPRDSRREFITEPYVDGGIPITSFCVPIMQEGRFLGVAGMDIALEKLQRIVEERKPFGTGFAMFFSPGGSIVYYPDENINYEDVFNEDNGKFEKTYRNIDEIPDLADTAAKIKTGESVIYTSTILPGRVGTEMLIIHVPVRFGDYPAQWTVAVAAPVNEVMKNRDQARKGMDGMVDGIRTQNEGFVRELHSQVQIAVEAAEDLKSHSLRRAILCGLIVLVVSVAVGAYFAIWVNRSIQARDFRYRQILDASSDPISVVDTAMKITFVNKQGLAVLGKSLEDCIGRDVAEIWKLMIGPQYENCGIRLLQSQRKNLASVEFSGACWDVTSQYIVDAQENRDGVVEIFKNVSDRENVFRLVKRVSEVIRSTVEQTSSIAQAASDLSQGAEQQTQSVESITSDMKTAGEQTESNANNAEQANGLSANAGKAATLGQKRMQEMVQSMNHIRDNAQNMRAVIKTIDDIAFQTNLLALNAAVEAARAGTHGKGFAVVAEEVRNLASRSAKAAQETEELILKNNQQIEGGVSIADQTAEALNAIADHVTGVSELISQITGSSKTQSTSVGHMNATLLDIDRVTRQNLDLASTTSEAARMLSSEVGELQELMEMLQGR